MAQPHGCFYIVRVKSLIKMVSLQGSVRVGNRNRSLYFYIEGISPNRPPAPASPASWIFRKSIQEAAEFANGVSRWALPGNGKSLRF